jgi:hypothetical protein
MKFTKKKTEPETDEKLEESSDPAASRMNLRPEKSAKPNKDMIEQGDVDCPECGCPGWGHIMGCSHIHTTPCKCGCGTPVIQHPLYANLWAATPDEQSDEEWEREMDAIDPEYRVAEERFRQWCIETGRWKTMTNPGAGKAARSEWETYEMEQLGKRVAVRDAERAASLDSIISIITGT